MNRLDFRSYMSSGIYAYLTNPKPCAFCGAPTINVRPVLNPDRRTFSNYAVCTVDCARALSRKGNNNAAH